MADLCSGERHFASWPNSLRSSVSALWVFGMLEVILARFAGTADKKSDGRLLLVKGLEGNGGGMEIGGGLVSVGDIMG